MDNDDQKINFIGKCNFRGNERIFGIKKHDRRQHMYVIGKTGTGKTTLLENLVLQDIQAGNGLGIIDPHGEFVERVLSQIPESRKNDVVYFNPVDDQFPIGFNVLEVPDPQYKHLVVSGLLGIFTKIWANVWSARMEYILQNCILALTDTPGTTLLGIPRILVDKEYREKIVANVKDPVVKSFWIHEYETWRDQFRNEAIVPIQNKVGQFLNTGFVRNIVGQQKSTIHIPDIMNSKKILLVNVSKGKIGEDNSALLGAMIITTIQLASMERVRIPEDERVDYYLYVDEFQNFATDSFASILSEARKYRLDLTIAHQYIGQLVTDVSTKVRDAVFGNTGTMIAFRVGATDAEFLEKEFEPEFMGQDLISLPNHHIYLKIMVDGITSRPFSATTLPPLKYVLDPKAQEEVTREIIALSQKNYGKPLAEVDAEIRRWSGAGELGSDYGSGAPAAGTEKFPAVCWNCGKETTVPFKPDGKRPVYCQQCYKLIEEGKLVPLPDRMPHVGKARFSSTLGDLGIEFGGGQHDRRMPAAVQTERYPDQDQGRPPRFSPGAQRQLPPREYRTERQEPREDRERPQQRSFQPRQGREEGDRNTQTQREFQPREYIPREERSPAPMPRTGVRTQPVVRSPSAGKRVPLSALKTAEGESSSPPPKGDRKDERGPAPKPQVNVTELRKVLEGFLAKSTPKRGNQSESQPPEFPSQEQRPISNESTKEPPADTAPDNRNSNGSSGTHRVIQPGEKISF